jgi:hypothetical protein
VSAVFFLNHKWPENAPGETASKANEQGAAFAAYLARYFFQNGYETAAQLVVLTPYTGQVRGLV